MGVLVTAIGILLIGVLILSYTVQGAWRKGEKASLLDVGQGQYKRNARALWALILIAAIYGALLRYLRMLTGLTMLDGGIGVALGLYICAHPAANAVNMLFFERHLLDQLPSDWSRIRWLALNLLTLLAGWTAIYAGLTRLVHRTA
jgi:hypothetical protein